MKIAPKPLNEAERLAELLEFNILDSIEESDYDDITNIAAGICHMPISLISIVDKERQWFKSKVGLVPRETHRDFAFCAHAILNPYELFIVNDSQKDDRFYDNPLVTGYPHVNFYAGVPLVNKRGNAFGTLCVIDNKPNEITREQQETLKALARQIVAFFEMRKLNDKLIAQQGEMEMLNQDLSRFAHIVAHDIKSPCASLAMSAAYLKDAYAGVLDADGRELLSMMEATSTTAIKMVDGVLRHTTIVNQNNIEKEQFTFGAIMDEVRKLIILPPGFFLQVANKRFELYTSHYVLLQILLNLCTNAVRYNDKEHGEIAVSVSETDHFYIFAVRDNGTGISENDQQRIFDLFSTLGVKDRDNNTGFGIGLSTVKRLVQKMNGEIDVTSVPGSGSMFTFTIKK